MTSYQAAKLHAANALVIIAAAVTLLITRRIDAATGTALIAAAGGLSLGVGAVSIGAGSGQPTAVASSVSNGTSTVPTL